MAAATSDSTHKNRILAALPREDFDRFFADLQPVSLTLKQVLHEVGTPVDGVYFIEQGVASMLGVRRAGITETAGELQRSGLIRNHRGEVTVVDRPGLEALACECYGIDHARLERLLGAPPPGPGLDN